MASKKENPLTPESSTDITPKAYYYEGKIFTVDFTDNEERSWTYFTEWTCIPKSGECEIILTRGINEHLCNMMRHFDRPPSVKLASLRNPEQKVILVFGHDTEANAFNMFLKYTDVRNTVVSFLQKIKIPVEDIKVRVRLTRTSQSAGQQHKGYNCIFDSTADYCQEEKSETTWFCIPDTPNLDVDNETSNSQFTRFKLNIRSSFGACLGRVSTGSVIFTFHHGSTADALEMISHYQEVRAMILDCLQGMDSRVTEIQMEVQLQDFIDPRSLPEHGDQDKRYVDKQEYDKAVKDLSEQVATLTLQLQEMKEKEQAQLADIRLSMWKTRPGSPQPSESSGFFTATDTMTDVGVEEFQDATDVSEPEGGHRQKGDASKPQHTSGTVTDLRRQLADMKQELNATTERMHRLEIAQSKGPVTGKKADSKAWSQMEARRPGPTQKSDVPAWSQMEARRPGPTQKSDVPATTRERDTRKSGTPSRPDTRATPTPARRYTRADADLHVACRAGKLAEVKRILDTGRADVNCRSVDGMTPVMWAAGWEHRDVVELLVSRGADVSLVDDDGDNILHWACLGGDRKTVEFVLSLDGVDINSRGLRSWTPVMTAARRGHRDVVELLVSRGADVSLVTDVGDNILHYACVRGDRKTVEFVLSLDGVDVNARNNDGETAADLARLWGHRQLSDLLVSRGTQ